MVRTFVPSLDRLLACLTTALIAFMLAACSSGGGSGGDGPGEDLPGAVAVQVDISLLVDSGLEPQEGIGGSVQCPGGASLPMVIDAASATATCDDLDPGAAQFTIHFDYRNGGSPVMLAEVVRPFEVVAGQTRTLAFALTAADLADDNDDGVSNLNDLLLLQDLGANAFLSGLTLACTDPGLPSCHNLTLVVPAGQAVPGQGFLAGAAVSGLTDYTSTQSARVEAITVTPTALGPGATITINGDVVPSGAASDPVPLNIDDTVITIVVTSPDGLAEVTYRVFVSSLAQFDADLVALSLSAGVLDPVFDRDVKDYVSTVDFAVANVTVSATASQPAATITVEGAPAGNPVPLGVGVNEIEIVVTAPDGLTQQQYKIELTRYGSADLAELVVTGTTDDDPPQQIGLSIVPGFQPSIEAYDVDAEFRIVAITVTAVAAAEGALIRIDGEDPGPGGTGAPIAIEVGQTEVTVEVTHPVSPHGNPLSRVYTLSILRQDPPRYDPEAYLKPAASGDRWHFGTSIAVSADGNTVAVGAPGPEDIENNNRIGLVEIYIRVADDWSRQETLQLPPGAAVGDRFGQSVSLSADGDIVAVGSPARFPGADVDDEPAHGAVYIYNRDGSGSWGLPIRIEPFKPVGDDSYGYSIALSGDGRTLAVGAPEDSSGVGGVRDFAIAVGEPDNIDAPWSGAVYMYNWFDGLGWVPDVFIKVPNPDYPLIKQLFGWGVELSHDGSVLAVGMPGESNDADGQSVSGFGESGAVYVYARNGAGWIDAPAYLKAQIPRAAHRFGSSVSLSAEGAMLAVGAVGQNSQSPGIWDTSDANFGAGQSNFSIPAQDSGAVYIFERNEDSDWLQQVFIKASTIHRVANFGQDLALSGDGSALAVGAPGDRSASTTVDGDESDALVVRSGAVHVFQREAGEPWELAAYIKVPNSRTGIAFGTGVAISASGDLVAGGAPGESSATTEILTELPYPGDNAAPDRGAVYLYRSAE